MKPKTLRERYTLFLSQFDNVQQEELVLNYLEVAKRYPRIKELAIYEHAYSRAVRDFQGDRCFPVLLYSDVAQEGYRSGWQDAKERADRSTCIRYPMHEFCAVI